MLCEAVAADSPWYRGTIPRIPVLHPAVIALAGVSRALTRGLCRARGARTGDKTTSCWQKAARWASLVVVFISVTLVVWPPVSLLTEEEPWAFHNCTCTPLRKIVACIPFYILPSPASVLIFFPILFFSVDS